MNANPSTSRAANLFKNKKDLAATQGSKTPLKKTVRGLAQLMSPGTSTPTNSKLNLNSCNNNNNNNSEKEDDISEIHSTNTSTVSSINGDNQEEQESEDNDEDKTKVAPTNKSKSKNNATNNKITEGKKVPWKEDESVKILVGVEIYGVGSWARIKDENKDMFKNRSSVQIKDKYRNLIKIQNSEAYKKLMRKVRIELQSLKEKK